MFEKIVNYFQRVLSGKMEKGDWVILIILFILFGSIFVFSWWLGGPVGGFTFILAIATIWNAKITQGLLKQSKEAFKQSKTAFENDVFRKMIFSLLQLDAQLIAATVSNRNPQLLALALGMLGSLKESDSLIYERIERIVKELWPQKKQALGKQTPAISILKQAIEEINKK